MSKIKITSTTNHCFTIGKEYEIIGKRNISDDGYKCKIVIVIDDDGDEYHIGENESTKYELLEDGVK